MKKVMGLVLSVLLVLTIGACKKKEEALPETGMQPMPGITMPPQPTQVVVPDNVKGKWASVKIAVENKIARTSKDVTIKIGAEYTIPESNLKIKVGEFLPDFKMEGSVITSATDQMNNPAVRVIVFEGGKEIFKGWLYSKFPAIHPFQHEKYGFMLKEGIKG